MSKHKIIRVMNDPKQFEYELDRVSGENNVFATQTHINWADGDVLYHAVCFVRD